MEPAFGPPNADSARQAIHAIRGYEYQILAAALAWVDVEENGLIYLEVAEDGKRLRCEFALIPDHRGGASVPLVLKSCMT